MRSSSYNIVAFAFAFAFAVSRPASSFVAPERAPRSGGIIVGIRALDASSPPRDDIIPGGDDDDHHRRDHDDDGLGGGGFFGIGGWGWGGVAEMEEEPLDRIFRRGVALQRAGDGAGCLREYERFLKAAEHHGADPSLYAEVHANVGAMHAADISRVRGVWLPREIRSARRRGTRAHPIFHVLPSSIFRKNPDCQEWGCARIPPSCVSIRGTNCTKVRCAHVFAPHRNYL